MQTPAPAASGEAAGRAAGEAAEGGSKAAGRLRRGAAIRDALHGFSLEQALDSAR